jgi:hypothetical protein
VDKPKLSPSLGRIPSAPAPDETEQEREDRERRNATSRRMLELDKKRVQRKRTIVEAMKSLLPDEDEAESRVYPFVSGFESTYCAAQRKDGERPAPAEEVKKQLSNLARKCRELAKDLGDMHLDAIQEWGGAAGAGGPIAVWQLSELLTESAVAAEQARTGRPAAKRGHPGDAMATAMTEGAAFAYTRLTGKTIDQGTKEGSFDAFLEKVFEAYGLDTDPPQRQHRIRALKNSKFWSKLP